MSPGVSDRDRQGRAALHIACIQGRADAVSQLLDAGADPNTTDYNGYTPLHRSCAEGHSDVIELLLQHQADTNMQSRMTMTTPLMIIASSSSQMVPQRDRIVRTLTKYGALINLTDKKGWSTLHHAVSSNREDIIPLLIEVGADVNAGDSEGDTPLHLASQRANKIMVKLLLYCGAKVNAVNKNGLTPLHWVCANTHDMLVPVLLHSGANINQCDNEGRTPLFLACCKGGSSLQTVRHLLPNADTNIPDQEGCNVLHVLLKLVVYSNHGLNPQMPELIQLLLNHGVHVDVFSNDGETPFQLWQESLSRFHTQDAETVTNINNHIQAAYFSLQCQCARTILEHAMAYQDALPQRLATFTKLHHSRWPPVVKRKHYKERAPHRCLVS